MRPSSLLKSGARRVLVDEIGRIRDPGPHKITQGPRN
jgi:hypothetical protein